MKRPVSFSFCLVLLPAVTGLGVEHSLAASGLETTAGISASIEHSDNIGRKDDNDIPQLVVDDEKRSDVESQIRLSVGVKGSTSQFDTQLDYTFTARDFRNDQQNDDEIVVGSARILWTPLPDRFAWELTNNVSDSVRDDRLADIPNNRQQRNIFSTGPNFILRLSPVDRLTAELRYLDVNVEESDENNTNADTADQENNDSERRIGRLLWTHGLSRVSDFLVNAEYEDVEASVDVTITRLLVGYRARLRRGSYEIYLGTNKAERDIGDDFDGSIIRVTSTHDFGGHGLDFALIKELTDTSVGLGASSLRSDTFSPRDSNIDSFDIVERQRADIAYQNTLVCAACTIQLSVFFDDQDSQKLSETQDTLTLRGDQQSYGARLNVIYALRKDVDLLADANYEFVDFVDDPLGLEYDSIEYMLGVDYNVFRDFSIGLRVKQFSRDANVEGFDNEELRGGIDFRYDF